MKTGRSDVKQPTRSRAARRGSRPGRAPASSTECKAGEQLGRKQSKIGFASRGTLCYPHNSRTRTSSIRRFVDSRRGREETAGQKDQV